MTPTTETTFRFSGDWQFMPVLLVALSLSGLMFWLYRREVRGLGDKLAWLPAMLRSLAVFILVLALAGPVLRHETTMRQLGRIIIALDASQSMKLVDDAKPNREQGTGNLATSSRWSLAQDVLFKGEPSLLKTLSETSDVELLALRGANVQRLWWRRQGGKDTSGELPTRIDLQPDAASTDLDQGLRQALGPAAAGSALVVLTDGQHNSSGSPEEFSTSLKQSAVPVFSLGFGTEIPPADLALVDVSAPEAVFTAERVEGIITLRDSMPANLPGTVRIESQGKLLWEQAFTTDGKGERRLPYSFLMKDMPGAQPDEADKNLRMFNVVVGIAGDKASTEKTRSNNAREVALHLLAKKRKLLMLDGRARWETRYAHNHFDRDDRWEVRLAFDDYKGDTDNALVMAFPKTKDELFTYDLVVLGDVSPERLKTEHLDWLVEFVEKRGGGLILIDGARGHLQEWSKAKAASLIPVQWADAKGVEGPLTWKLTTDADRYTALRLSDSPSANAALWPTLPPAMWSARAKASLTAVSLASLEDKSKATVPAFVFQSIGAGAVLYLASDELWRWRYQVADQHHQRLWVQLAAWIAAPPFQAENKTLSLGTDRLRYGAGEQGELRVRLRAPNGEIIADAHPRAFLIHEGEDVAALELEADPTHAGVYRAVTPPLKPGSWQVAVAEGPNATRSDLRLTLRVADTGNQELSTLTMNRPLLETMARNTGGRFLRAEQAKELPNLLQAVDRKQTIVRETLLWSSWWWFGAVIVLLTAEWLLRRKLRLV